MNLLKNLKIKILGGLINSYYYNLIITIMSFSTDFKILFGMEQIPINDPWYIDPLYAYTPHNWSYEEFERDPPINWLFSRKRKRLDEEFVSSKKQRV